MRKYQLRVVIEKAELDIKIQRLDAFLASSQTNQVRPKELVRMVDQLDAMMLYSNILQSRISKF